MHACADPATTVILGGLLWVAARNGSERTCVAMCEDDELFLGGEGRRLKNAASTLAHRRADLLRWFAENVKRRNRPENGAVIRTLATLVRLAGGPPGPVGRVTRSCSAFRKLALDALENDADRWLLLDALT